MIEKIDSSQIQELLGKASSRQANSTGDVPSNDEDVSLQVNYASLIDQATQIPQTDTEQVRQAQELLATGQLETPENIRAAADDIITFGI